MEDLKRWEYFCDSSYYDKWAVRDKADRSFHSAIHVGTKEEAEFLANSLNELLTLQDRYNAQEKKLEDYKGDVAFIKRWVQRVYDKETSLEEFYGVLRYHTPLKPVEALTQLKAKEA